LEKALKPQPWKGVVMVCPAYLPEKNANNVQHVKMLDFSGVIFGQSSCSRSLPRMMHVGGGEFFWALRFFQRWLGIV